MRKLRSMSSRMERLDADATFVVDLAQQVSALSAVPPELSRGLRNETASYRSYEDYLQCAEANLTQHLLLHEYVG